MAIDPSSNGIRQGVTLATDAATAVREIREQLDQPNLALAMLFIDPALGADEIAAALRREWPDAPVVGCTGWGHLS